MPAALRKKSNKAVKIAYDILGVPSNIAMYKKKTPSKFVTRNNFALLGK